MSMVTVNLGEFIASNRAELLDRCMAQVTQRLGQPPSTREMERGIPLFMDQLVHELSGRPTARAMAASAVQHGRDLFVDGFTVGQLVHDYGDVCQSITDLAVETHVPISADDFRTLNRCLDDAIAGAVGAYADRKRVADTDGSLQLRNLIYNAITGFEAIRAGRVGVAGATGDLVNRTLLALQDLVGRRPL
jgi:hypothetical protein